MRVVVPFAAREPKTRLADVLSPDERSAFAAAMLDDVLAAVRATGREPEVLATGPVGVDAPVTVDDRPLTEAVNAVLAETDRRVAVVMADLALATPDALDRLFEAESAVAIAPGRGGGTNALAVAHPEFRVDYHGTSYLDHLGIAREVGASVSVVDSHRLATDVDERADLAEVLIHGGGEGRSRGRSAEWLRSAGFSLAGDESRVGVVRE
ncbi:2-phospho-L-lactate guanylyltransferase [Halorussus salilacus]|uniref:2-phospho-L-lactate guanylyltransferase n=1 Tax=Halorussus salilacus TaxID=2953750 RepID=UPI0020A19F4F|nr:2-phospho-L-lactate guanylyltransferase [Halorussus salilacus]USZ67324.1 2-phospho-L-lactate guanylyltransferase [Halorussus salilacus]